MSVGPSLLGRLILIDGVTTTMRYNPAGTSTYIVARHLATRHLPTRGNNKILRTQTHISSSEEILPASLVAPLPSSKQINHPYLHKVNTTSHPPPLCALCNTHIISSTALTLHCQPWICGQTRWNTSRKIGLPPLARVMGVGRQHQQWCERTRVIICL